MSDLISRQAAIETVKKHYRVDNDLLEVIAYEIEALPSAQLAQDLPKGCTDTISRQAALSALNGCTEIYLNNLPPTIYKKDAIKAVKTLPSAQPGWIPCSEKLPKKYDNYLITTDDEDVDIGTFHPEFKRWSICDADGFMWMDGVLAWCELPKPWEGGQDG